MGWYDKECPTDSYDAYREGRWSRSWESNPYEHGRDDWSGKCREAYDEWERGHRAAEREREEERVRRRQELEYERQREEEAYYASQYEQQYPEPEYPQPEESSPPAHNAESKS